MSAYRDPIDLNRSPIVVAFARGAAGFETLTGLAMGSAGALGGGASIPSTTFSRPGGLLV
jgi:hypothetical protein